MKLSIIIPFFNAMQYIEQLVESIPERADIEILIADDKSKPEETAQLKQLVTQWQVVRNIQYFYNDGTKSAGACRNIGLRHATGEWVLFADSDDYFMPNLYETIAPWFDKETDLVYFTPTSIDRVTGEATERHRGFADWVKAYSTQQNDATTYRLKSFYVVPWSKLIRRSLLIQHEILFDEVLASNDVMFSVKTAFAAEQIAVSEAVLYCVTKSPGSLVYSVQRAVLDARYNVFISYYHYLKARVPKEIFRAFLLNGRNIIISYAVQKQSPVTVVKVACKLIYHRVPVIETRLLNPVRVLRTVKGHWAKYQNNKNYYKNHVKK